MFTVDRKDFGPGFVFGAATAAYQIEGGQTDGRGHSIAERKLIPQDLAATVFKFMGIDTDAQWIDPQARPIAVVTEGGKPIHELF